MKRRRDNARPWERRAQMNKRQRRDRRATAFEVRLRRLFMAGRASDGSAEVSGEMFGARVTAVLEDNFKWSISAAHDDLPDGLFIGHQHALSTISRMVGGDIETGDDVFDERIIVRGQTVEVLSVLSLSTRKRVRRLIKAGGSVRDGRVSWRGVPGRSSEEVVGRTRAVAWLADALALAENPREALLRNVLKEPNPAVCARSLRALARADAALLKGPGPLRALDQAADSSSEAARVCAREALVAALDHAATAIDRLKQPCLLLLLDDDDYRVSALGRLGERGSREAVPHIARATGGLFTARDVRAAGQAAIAASAKRLGGIDGGELSVAIDAGEGALSAAEQDGETSLVD